MTNNYCGKLREQKIQNAMQRVFGTYYFFGSWLTMFEIV